MADDGDASPSASAGSKRTDMDEDRSLHGLPADASALSADARLLERIRTGDPDAGHRLIREYYSGVYRYLLYLTGSREAAEDLTQETFLRAWRHLATFQGRAALRTWLHRIAHREFLQALRRQRRTPAERRMVSLQEAGEIPETRTAQLAGTVDLEAILGKLPIEEREIVVLHYLEGYEHEEIAHILGIPLRRVRHRLSEARYRLQQELGEGDLAYLNEPAVPMRQWAWLPLEQMCALEGAVGTPGRDGRFAAPAAEGFTPSATGPDRWRLAGGEPPPVEHAMGRREFLRHVAVGAVGMMLPESEQEVVDGRLTRKVTLAFRGTALSDLCDHLRQETGIHLAAGPSVADEKVTLFCRQMPLREVMRQLSRPFGYAWLRSGLPSPSRGSRSDGSARLDGGRVRSGATPGCVSDDPGRAGGEVTGMSWCRTCAPNCWRKSCAIATGTLPCWP